MQSSRYRFATRLNSFRRPPNGRRSVSEALHLVAAVPAISVTEPSRPQHFVSEDDADVLSLTAKIGLSVTAINLRFDGADIVAGAFTDPIEQSRMRAIERCCSAVELAASNGIDHVILPEHPSDISQ